MMIVSLSSSSAAFSAPSRSTSRSRSRSRPRSFVLFQVVTVVAIFNLVISAVGIVHAQNDLDDTNDGTTAAELYSRTTACDAKYNAPCSRFNSQVLARETALQLSRELLVEGNSNDPTQVFDKVNSGQYNVDVGFYPFVFERTTGIAMAHGSNPNFTGKTLEAMLDGKSFLFAFVLWFGLCDSCDSCDSLMAEHVPQPPLTHPHLLTRLTRQP